METSETKVNEKEAKKVEPLDWEGRKAETNRMIKNHMYGAMGIGLIPLPVVDFLALTGIQIRLLYKLSKFYGVDFSKDKAKKYHFCADRQLCTDCDSRPDSQHDQNRSHHRTGNERFDNVSHWWRLYLCLGPCLCAAFRVWGNLS